MSTVPLIGESVHGKRFSKMGVRNRDYCTPPPPCKHGLVQARRPRLASVFLVFSDHGFCGQKCNVTGCAPIVEGKGGWIMFVVFPPAHTNMLLATATQCCLF